ncbi:MAG: hypothetical protein KUG69_04060 [Marinosulfonomonas sp.]|nr:hypothetical protein [Marinosulfonomonas sp.]
MTGFSSVRSAVPPQDTLRSPQEQATKPAAAPGAGAPFGQRGRLSGEEVSKSGNDAATPLARLDENTPTGPPPAFEASLLELETNLEIVIKRVEAAREKARTALAISPEPPLDRDAARDPTLPL